MKVIGRWEIDVEQGEIHTREGLAKRIDARGYKIVDTTYKGKKIRFKQHQIIAIKAGLDPRNRQINHIDGVKSNNKINNLEIVTQSENIKHAYKTNLWTPVNRIFTEEDLVNIEQMYLEGKTQKEISIIYECHEETIGRYLRGKTYKVL